MSYNTFIVHLDEVPETSEYYEKNVFNAESIFHLSYRLFADEILYCNRKRIDWSILFIEITIGSSSRYL